MLGIELTHWTIRLALLCLAARIGGGLRWGNADWWFPRSRAIWTVGFVFFVAHVACAFHFYHEWSHAKAFQSTAEQTERQMGVRFGEGIYVSYAFTLLWLIDVTWQWIDGEGYQRLGRIWAIPLLLFMSFIAFNGAAVFEDGVTRWVGIPVSVLLFIAAIGALLRRPAARDKASESLVPNP